MAEQPIVNVAAGVSRPLRIAGRVASVSTHTLRDLWNAGRSTYERTLHPLRHRAVRRRLSTAARPRRILVVCNGNVCRSPYLTAVLRSSLLDVEVTSAGFVGGGRSVPPSARSLAHDRGLDLSMHRSQLISQSEVFRADLVLVMDPDQARRLAISFGVAAGKIVIAPDLSTRFHGTRSIHDPWNQPIHVFASSFDHLDDCAETLIDIVRGTN